MEVNSTIAVTIQHPKDPIMPASRPETSIDSFEYFLFKKGRDLPSDARSTLLVIASVIATVSFQAGLSPPDSVLKLPSSNHNTYFACCFLFLFGNSLGLAASICILIYLTAGFPFRKELYISLYSIVFTYVVVIYSIINGAEAQKEWKYAAYISVTAAFFLPLAYRWIPRVIRKTWRDCKLQVHMREETTSPITH